ncbi:beta-ketoacyl synthase N-terminal-like domain-containing protein [Actinophytocola sp.]|uniref:beta-ketoacyl synthase N-terminal-like domain-containing protein n=1 Tax=Actinophytocola sp. TaxID=1872138 RepID=UPI0039C89BB5
MKSTDIAVVDMAGRLPGAADFEQFWEMLRTGSEGAYPSSRCRGPRSCRQGSGGKVYPTTVRRANPFAIA